MDAISLIDSEQDERVRLRSYETQDTSSSEEEDKATFDDVLLIALMAFFSALDTREKVVVCRSTIIQKNADLQEIWENRESAIKFEILKPNPDHKPVDPAELDRIQQVNQKAMVEKNNMQNTILTLQQGCRGMMSQVSADTNLMQQDGSMCDGQIKLRGMLGRAINDMLRPKK